MNRFKFHPTTTSKTTAMNNRIDEDLWEDDIDEQTLLQASQSVELEGPSKSYDEPKIEIDPSTLAKMMPKNDDDVWKTEPVIANKITSTQTVFGDDNARRGPLPKGKPGFQNSFDEPSSKTGLMRPPPTKPLQRAIVSGGGAVSNVRNVGTDDATKRELERLKAENKKLMQNQSSKTGEITFLRNEMSKRQTNYDKEKQELFKKLEVKDLSLKESENTRSKEAEVLRTELDFSKRELEQAMETIKKLQRPEASAQSLKRTSLEGIQSVPKRPKIAPNIDESFFEDNQVKKPTSKPVLFEISVQTNVARTRQNVLNVDSYKSGSDGLSEIGALAGTMSLVTLAEAEIVPAHLSSVSDFERAIFIGRCFNAFCLSAANNFVNLAASASTPAARRRQLQESGSSENKNLKQLSADLAAARLLISYMLEDFSDVQPTFVTEHGFVALQQLVGILTDKNISFKTEDLTELARSLLCSVFEAGCLDEKLARELLDEFRKNKNKSGTRDDVEFVRKTANIAMDFFTVLKSANARYSSVQCSKSKGLCIINFVWHEVDSLFCGHVSSGDNDDTTTTTIPPPTLRSLSSIEANVEKSINLKVADAFLDWLSSLMASESLSVVCINKKSKCHSCYGDVFKALAVVTYSVVSEWSDFKAKGLNPPIVIVDIVARCLLYLHYLWTLDQPLYVKSVAEYAYVQRRYIWMTKMLHKLKPKFESKFDETHGDVLSDLTIECDDDAPFTL